MTYPITKEEERDKKKIHFPNPKDNTNQYRFYIQPAVQVQPPKHEHTLIKKEKHKEDYGDWWKNPFS